MFRGLGLGSGLMNSLSSDLTPVSLLIPVGYLWITVHISCGQLKLFLSAGPFTFLAGDIKGLAEK